MGHLILRVDDVGWLPPEKTRDVGLDYFSRWRNALGSRGLPIYYGVIPNQIDAREIAWLKENLVGGEEVAVHGYDHAKDAVVTDNQMREANLRLEKSPRCRVYIAPFNRYTERTVRQWGNIAPGGYFLGGFFPDDHRLEYLPVERGNCLHVPAIRETYNHTEPLLEALPAWLDLDCPIVVTLHATWGWQRLDLLERITRLIRDHLEPIDFTRDWLSRSSLSLARLTAPHFLAYSWIRSRIARKPLKRAILDFGSRESELPSKLALWGSYVSTFDRDETSASEQKKISANLRARNVTPLPSLDGVQGLGAERGKGSYDVITACWALQHNLPAETEIPKLVKQLASLLKPGGSLLIVSSYTPDRTFEQHNRKDPQTVLNLADHQRLIVRPSGLEFGYQSPEFFRYQHGTTSGAMCDSSVANAICYELTKV